MGPFMRWTPKLVAERASDPPPRRVLDMRQSWSFRHRIRQRFPKCHITGLDWVPL